MKLYMNKNNSKQKQKRCRTFLDCVENKFILYQMKNYFSEAYFYFYCIILSSCNSYISCICHAYLGNVCVNKYRKGKTTTL